MIVVCRSSTKLALLLILGYCSSYICVHTIISLLLLRLLRFFSVFRVVGYSYVTYFKSVYREVIRFYNIHSKLKTIAGNSKETWNIIYTILHKRPVSITSIYYWSVRVPKVIVQHLNHYFIHIPKGLVSAFYKTIVSPYKFLTTGQQNGFTRITITTK